MLTQYRAPTALGSSPDVALLVDIDLSSLGSPLEPFKRRFQNVLKGYALSPGLRHQEARAPSALNGAGAGQGAGLPRQRCRHQHLRSTRALATYPINHAFNGYTAGTATYPTKQTSTGYATATSLTMNPPRAAVLFRPHEPAFCAQYAEVKERSRAAGALLPGTPGQLVPHDAAGRRYWYRRYYPVPGGKPTDDYVCRADDQAALEAAQDAIAFADWMARQVRALRKLDFQVADKDAARVLVELHNQGLLTGGDASGSGLMVVGSLAYMAWLNELGVRAMAARTQDIDLARRQPLKLAAPRSFLHTVQATSLKFLPVPTLSAKEPSTSVKLPGAAGLRVDLLADGPVIGDVIPIPELNWHAQTIPHFAYLLQDARAAVMLAGGQAVPVNLPAPERFVWHKLYSSTARLASRDKASKDLQQAATLAAALVEHDDAPLVEALADAPTAVVKAARTRLPALRDLMAAHPQAISVFEDALQ